MKKNMIKMLRKYKWKILKQIIFICVNTYLLTIPPIIIGIIIDEMYDINKNSDIIVQQSILLILVSIIRLIMRVAWKYYDTYIQMAMEKDMKDKLFKQLTKLKVQEIQSKKNGELMSFFVKDISEIRVAIQRVLSYGVRIITTLIIVGYSMIVKVDFRLTIFTMIPIIITGFIIVKIKKYIEKNFQRSQKYFTQLSEYVQESTDAIRTTKAYSQEGFQLKKFIKIDKKLKESNNAVDVSSTLLSIVINICFGISYGISIIYGSSLVINGIITIGSFIAFNSYIGLFIGPVSWIPTLVSRIKRGEISYKRLDKIFEMEKEKIIIPKKEEKEKGIIGDIQIKDLTFNYPESLEKTLENINLDIKEGETLGIIGTVGSGKTTLMNLLLKLYHVPNGKIFIDRKDINEIPNEVLRDNICYITQDNFLFSTTLKENINLFKDIYEDVEIEESIKNAMIYDEISEMEDGLNTVIGERGIDLSGGQKQRVIISRAFLNKSSIIIFDDTFSALDNKTEQLLLKNIKKLTNNKTCIIISNRISDIKQADKIIVMDNGIIIEKGEHETLLQKKGKYYKFYKEQVIQSNETILG